MHLSVIIPTHNPHVGRLRRTLVALQGQTLPAAQWEIIVIDNASTTAVDNSSWSEVMTGNVRIICEPQLGLTHARKRGFSEARGAIVVLVDDDNVLAPDYLETALALFTTHPRIGILGGRSQPEFEQTPESWVHEFVDLLACRDHGANQLVSYILKNPTTGRNEYPAFAPIGAGMALRREAAQAWLIGKSNVIDRHGDELTSSGDNDIVLTIMKEGWGIGYFPSLALTHLIPASRTTVGYLSRLNRGIQKSWTQVLAAHDASPWLSLARWTVPLRQFKAWFTYCAWSGPAARIRWQGACGHFEGRASSRRNDCN